MGTVSHPAIYSATMTSGPDDEADLDEREDPDADDMDWDAATVNCPYCNRQIAEEAERCPKCGSYISEEGRPRQKSLWMVAIVILLILTFLGIHWLW